MAKKEQKRRSCIFCGGFPLSKEHIWPEWLRQYIPRSTPHTVHAVSLAGSEDLAHGRLSRPGDVRSQRLRVVCTDCNSGWMSRMQSVAKPHIANMIEHDHLATDESARLALANWATMFSFVWEQAEPRIANSTQSERYGFRTAQEPPPNWSVWVARTELDLQRFPTFRRSGTLEKPSGEKLPIHVTVMRFGTWMMLCTSYVEDIAPEALRDLVQVWPRLGNMLLFGKTLSLDEAVRAAVSVIPDQTGEHDERLAWFLNQKW